MQQNNLIAPIIVAIGVIIAAVSFAMVTTLLESADSGADLRLTRLEEAFDAESAQRARLEAEIGTLNIGAAAYVAPIAYGDTLYFVNDKAELIAVRRGKAQTPALAAASLKWTPKLVREPAPR